MRLSAYDKQNVEKIVHGHGDWFSAWLIRLIALKADDDNTELLRTVYPDHVAAVEAWRSGGTLVIDLNPRGDKS